MLFLSVLFSVNFYTFLNQDAFTPEERFIRYND